jgi:uncharacterized protein YneF (UPF0154 family)
MELVLVFVGLLMGSVLGYWLAKPRVKVLEKALLKAAVRESELEMALDYQRVKAMGKD